MSQLYVVQPTSRIVTQQIIAYDGNTAVTNAFSSQTYHVRLSADSACHYQIGDGTQTASTSTPFLPAYAVEYVRVTPGQRISAIKAATDGLVTATAGTLYIAELTA